MKENVSNEIVREIMADEGVTQKVLAERLGYSTVSSVTGRLNTKKLSVDRMVAMLGAMGYEVIVRKAGEEEGGKEWRVVG